MEILAPLTTRQSINKAMLAFILEQTLYDIEDIARLIRYPKSSLEHILQNDAALHRTAEINLIKLYMLALEPYIPLVTA